MRQSFRALESSTTSSAPAATSRPVFLTNHNTPTSHRCTDERLPDLRLLAVGEEVVESSLPDLERSCGRFEADLAVKCTRAHLEVPVQSRARAGRVCAKQYRYGIEEKDQPCRHEAIASVLGAYPCSSGEDGQGSPTVTIAQS